MTKINYFECPFHTGSLFKGSLFTLLFMTFGMVLIGGLTRLTGSGLSIVEWKPVMGIFPPISLDEWLLEFNKYKQSPEFRKINFEITLREFQAIFWLEYIHRLWGRLLGFVLLIPTYLMIFQKQHRELWLLLILLWVLGVAQGFMGWFMVKSGLIHDPYVSPYRLAAHLFLGFAIFGITLWMTLSLYYECLRLERKGFSLKAFKFLKRLLYFAILLVLFTAFLGALVAGLKAGLLYNTFPLMGESFIPRELLTQTPWWKDLFENAVSVQFLHRIFAILSAVTCVGIWLYQRNLLIPYSLSYALGGVALMALLQLTAGIFTLVFVVPISLAIVHQGFAFLLFGSLLYALFLLRSIKYD